MPQQQAEIGGVKLELRSVQRAKTVFKEADLRKLDTKEVNFLKGLPSMIKQNGLGQTAFLLSINHAKFYNLLGKFLGSGDLLGKIMSDSSTRQYVRMQREAIEYAAWMKQVALAFHKEKVTAKEGK
jgi:CRISPR/Cas system CMR-associated protein Cmr5 small subunit